MRLAPSPLPVPLDRRVRRPPPEADAVRRGEVSRESPARMENDYSWDGHTHTRWCGSLVPVQSSCYAMRCSLAPVDQEEEEDKDRFLVLVPAPRAPSPSRCRSCATYRTATQRTATQEQTCSLPLSVAPLALSVIRSLALVSTRCHPSKLRPGSLLLVVVRARGRARECGFLVFLALITLVEESMALSRPRSRSLTLTLTLVVW